MRTAPPRLPAAIAVVAGSVAVALLVAAGVIGDLRVCVVGSDLAGNQAQPWR